MVLAFLTHEPFYPPSGGGSAEAVYLVRELRRRGHQVHLFGPPVAGAEAVEREFGITLYPFRAWEMGRYTKFRTTKYVLYPFWLERMVAAAGRAIRFDLLLAQHAISAVAAGRLKRRLGVPLVMNFLDHLTGFMETWPVWLMPPPLLAVLKRYELSLPRRFDADAVLTVSDTLAERFARAGCARERLRPVYYGYDAAAFPLDEAALARRGERPPVVVMHGSLDHHHLGPIALAALGRIHAARPEVVFKFVGQHTPALRRFLAQAQRRLPGAELRCPGFIPYDRVAGELSTAAVGLVPYEESAGTHCAFVAKLVEYLGLGLPVVSTPLESAVSYFRQEPLVRFSGFDGRGFARQVLDWLAMPLERRNALARPASQRVREQLDWPVICRKAVDCLEAVHAGRAAPAP